MQALFLTITALVTNSLAEEVVKVSARDSYLEAYQETKTALKQTADKKSDRMYPVYPGAENAYGPPAPQYGPPSPQYGSPSPQYGPPAPHYGPPASQYGPPSPQYGAPAPQYGGFAEPAPQQYGSYPAPAYGPPAQNLQVFYGVPHAMISIWDRVWEKIKWKLDLLTLGKIILKLVIFKKIVSFIAILCLLLFIPKLKHKKLFLGGSSNGDDRTLTISQADERLDDLTSFINEAIDQFKARRAKSTQVCDTKYCESKKMLEKIETGMSYKKLAELYADELN